MWWFTDIKSAVFVLIKESRDTIYSGVTGGPQSMLHVRDSISKDARFRAPVRAAHSEHPSAVTKHSDLKMMPAACLFIYRGTSLIRNRPTLGPYSRPMSRALWLS